MGERFHEALPVDMKSSGDQLLLALLDLMKIKPYQDISISEICQKAKLSRTTFYKFLSGKDDLLDYLKEDLDLGYVTYKKSLESLDIPPERLAFYHYFSYWYQLREWVDVLIQNGLWEQIAMPTEKTYALISKRQWDSTLMQDKHNLEMIYQFIASGCVQLVKQWSLQGYQKTPEEMSELVMFTLSGRASRTKNRE